MATIEQLTAVAAECSAFTSRGYQPEQIATVARTWLERFEQTPFDRVLSGVEAWRADGSLQALPTAEELAAYVPTDTVPKARIHHRRDGERPEGSAAQFTQAARALVQGQLDGMPPEEPADDDGPRFGSSVRVAGMSACSGCDGSGLTEGHPVQHSVLGNLIGLVPCRECNSRGYQRWVGSHGKAPDASTAVTFDANEGRAEGKTRKGGRR